MDSVMGSVFGSVSHVIAQSSEIPIVHFLF